MKQAILNVLLIVMMLSSSVSTVVAASGGNMIDAEPQSQQAANAIVVSSVDFDDSTTGTWIQSGSPTLSYVDDGNNGQALSILRTNDFDGIQSPTGLLEAGVEYTFSMRARLPAAWCRARPRNHEARPVAGSALTHCPSRNSHLAASPISSACSIRARTTPRCSSVRSAATVSR